MLHLGMATEDELKLFDVLMAVETDMRVFYRCLADLSEDQSL